MERLEKLINTLKLTPHRQPELVKEASNRILSKSLRSDPNVVIHLRPLIEILIKYCDNEDSAQRSLFNDYLNSVILTYQHSNYKCILQVLLDEVINNGPSRAVSVAIQRISHLIRNIQPIELGCEPAKLLKALIEVARRSDDELLLKSLDNVIQCIIPYLDYHIRKSKEMQVLANSLNEVLFNNLQNESSQIKRLAASSISHLSLSKPQMRNILAKLSLRLEELISPLEEVAPNKFIGFCLCVKDIPKFADDEHPKIIDAILIQIESKINDSPLVAIALETLRELFRYQVDQEIIDRCVAILANRILFSEGNTTIKQDTKVILQSNSLSCIAAIVRQKPQILDEFNSIYLCKDHNDIAVRNQLFYVIGNYIDASWKFPMCLENPVVCEKVRKLWLELRATINDDFAHPDSLKSCVVAIRTCINTLIESDHCLHILEYQDIDRLINLFGRTNFRPLKIELLNLFASLNYRTLHYLERVHWSKMRARTAGSLTHTLQDRIVNEVVIPSLIDDHQKIRVTSRRTLVSLVSILYVVNPNNGRCNNVFNTSDPIVSLANNLVDEHLVVLKQANEIRNLSVEGDDYSIEPDLQDKLCARNDLKFLSSSIIQAHQHQSGEQYNHHEVPNRNQNRARTITNLSYIVSLLKNLLENSIHKGKSGIAHIVKAFHELSEFYPIYQYSRSWDCRASEYSECYTLLNFLLTYMENLTEPDIVVEDLEVYKNFLSLAQQLLHGLCHESVLTEYESQKMIPFHKRNSSFTDASWSDLTLKHPCISDTLDSYFNHLTKLLRLISCIIEERPNPYVISSKQLPNQSPKIQTTMSYIHHDILVSNKLLLGRIYRKLESSYKSGKKNLNQNEEKFFQIINVCLSSMSSLLEFTNMNKSIEHTRDILSHIKIISPLCCVPSIRCARQLLKSLFGVNVIALYQVDPIDWLEEDSWPPTTSNTAANSDKERHESQGVYHHLIDKPYSVFSNYYSMNGTRITPTCDKSFTNSNFESRRAIKVRHRIEDRIKSLFEFNPHQLISPRVRQISELLKNTITEFTPIVSICMNQFLSKGFSQYQSEVLHFMSYLLLLRVNYQKLSLANDFVASINRLLDSCGEKVFASRVSHIDYLLHNCFTFLTLLSHERGLSKPMFQVATVIQKFDELRAKLSMTSEDEGDVSTYLVPLLRCLIDDLFIYRTRKLQNPTNVLDGADQQSDTSTDTSTIFEAEKETVAQKLFDVIENSKTYDLISILIQESLLDSSEIKYKRLSKQLVTVIPNLLLKRCLDLVDYQAIDMTRKIIENISPEVFQPVHFIFATLIDSSKPDISDSYNRKRIIEFERWMSLVLIAIHILITQVNEEVFLARLRETMTEKAFVGYLLHIAQLCIAELFLILRSSHISTKDSDVLLVQQLSSYMLYLTHMFQSGLFFQLSKSAEDLMHQEIKEGALGPKSIKELYIWSRNPNNGFCLKACERMFFHIRIIYPDLTIFWCNVMMVLNCIDCNRDFWRDLLIYDCDNCRNAELDVENSMAQLIIKGDTVDKLDQDRSIYFRRSAHISLPSSLNLSDISFSDQLRRSFIKKIATAENRDKALNRNIIETSDEKGQLLEQEVALGNTEQCLAPNVELSRRGALCLVLDFVTISMNDVEHITWLIIHQINDIIRWSHETPIAEFINAVHGNSASSGIFIQAINSGVENLSSISFVSRILWTLDKVHYTQYGSLIVFLVEKLLSSDHIMPYRSLTRNIEEFACSTVQKLMNETNKSLVTTNDEIVNQLTVEDLDRIQSLLDSELYPKLAQILIDLKNNTDPQSRTPDIQLQIESDSDDDSEKDELEVLSCKVNLIYWLAEQNYTAHISTLIPALSQIKLLLSDISLMERLNDDAGLVCFLISAMYSLGLNILPPPTRLIKPKFWTSPDEKIGAFNMNRPSDLGRYKTTVKTHSKEYKLIPKVKFDQSDTEAIEALHIACLECLFLFENIDLLRTTPFQHFDELVIQISRIPLVNSFVVTPPSLWKQCLWPSEFNENDKYKTDLPVVTHEILLNDLGALDSFSDRILKLGWISRRQFEEIWMTFMGVLSATLSESYLTDEVTRSTPSETESKANLLASCRVVATITKLLLLAHKSVPGNPLSEDIHSTQSFEDRVIELSKAIATNITRLRKKTKELFDMNKDGKDTFCGPYSTGTTLSDTGFSYHLKLSAQKLRMNAILNVDIDMQDTVVIADDNSKSDEVDVESCLRLLISIYRQKLNDSGDVHRPSIHSIPNDSSSLQQQEQLQNPKSKNQRPYQIAPPLATAICQSIVTLSDMFTDYEQFEWMFETFVQMFKQAERNEDEIQMQYLIVGLCKASAVCCYDLPNELSTTMSINHREVMFEKCRQSLEKCLKSEFGPLKMNALYGAYYMLEDSINIVASGAWELDHFKQLRQSRLTWITRLLPIVLDNENLKLITKKTYIVKLLESFWEIVPVSDSKGGLKL